MKAKLRTIVILLLALLTVTMSIILIPLVWLGPNTQSEKQELKNIAQRIIAGESLENIKSQVDKSFEINLQYYDKEKPKIIIDNYHNKLELIVYNYDITDFRFIYQRVQLNFYLFVTIIACCIFVNWGIYKIIEKILQRNAKKH